MELQRYEVPSPMGTTYIFTDNPPAGASLVKEYQSQPQQPINKPSLEQRIEVLEKTVSNINNRLGIKTNSDSVDLNAASKLLDRLDSSASNIATTEIADTNNGTTNIATVIAAPTDPSSLGSLDPVKAAAIAKLNSSSSSASAAAEPVTPSSSGSAPIPSAEDIAKQLGDLT